MTYVEMQRFVELVAMLRYECPWDAEQTHTTLRSHLLEEAHELLEALDGYDEATGQGSKALEEELGDLLFQVVFHARIAADDGRFDLADVARGIHDKLRHRHPHVFLPTPDGDRGPHLEQVSGSDDVLANWDRIKQAEKGRESVLDGLVELLTDDQALGDLLLAITGAARVAGLDAEEALRGAVGRFSATVRTAEQNRLSGEDVHR